MPDVPQFETNYRRVQDPRTGEWRTESLIERTEWIQAPQGPVDPWTGQPILEEPEANRDAVKPVIVRPEPNDSVLRDHLFSQTVTHNEVVELAADSQVGGVAGELIERKRAMDFATEMAQIDAARAKAKEPARRVNKMFDEYFARFGGAPEDHIDLATLDRFEQENRDQVLIIELAQMEDQMRREGHGGIVDLIAATTAAADAEYARWKSETGYIET